VPAYNAEPWITETLRSILDQTIDPASYEIIVVDNGSLDHTLDAAAAALRGVPARVTLRSEPLRGPAHARNHGLRLARGSWIQFLDADDLLHPDKLRLQLNAARAADPEVGLIYSAWQRTEGASKVGIMPYIEDADAWSRVRTLLTTEGFIPTGGQLFRHSAVLAVGGYRDIGLVEDVDIYLRIAIASWRFQPFNYHVPLFVYRTHQVGSLSTNNVVSFWDGVVRNAAFAESWAREKTHAEAKVLPDQMVEVIADCYRQAARNFAGRDWARFDAVVERLKNLVGSVAPKGPFALRALSNFVGYKNAERVAIAYRGIKKISKKRQSRTYTSWMSLSGIF
jgi:teichuronic acid biosynthesis glycosyltransferase TuaG